MGILILVVFSVGVFVIGKWLFLRLRSFSGVGVGVAVAPVHKTADRITAGGTGLFGVPKYKDVIVPSHRDYFTVVYMDTAFKQYVFDVLSGWKFACDGKETKVLGAIAFFALGAALASVWLALTWMLFVAWAAFVTAPKATKIERKAAEYHKDRSPEFWLDVDLSIIESRARISEMTEAFRNSGANSSLIHW